MDVYLPYILASLAMTGTLIISARREEDYAFWKTIAATVLIFGVSIFLADVTGDYNVRTKSKVMRYLVSYIGYFGGQIAAVGFITNFFFKFGLKNGLILGVGYVLILLFVDYLARIM